MNNTKNLNNYILFYSTLLFNLISCEFKINNNEIGTYVNYGEGCEGDTLMIFKNNTFYHKNGVQNNFGKIIKNMDNTILEGFKLFCDYGSYIYKAGKTENLSVYFENNEINIIVDDNSYNYKKIKN